MDEKQIIYWRGQNEVRDDLITGLKLSGFNVSTVRFLADLMRRVQKGAPMAIVVDASASEEETIHRCGELQRNTPFHNIPILFLGIEIERHADSIRRSFRRIVPLPLPLRLDQLMDKVRSLGSGVSVSSGTFKVPEAKKDSTIRTSTGSLRLLREPPGYGGKVLATMAAADGFDDKQIIPAGHPFHDRIVRALGGMTRTSPWLGAHVRRVASFSTSLNKRLSGGKEANPAVATAGLMLNWGVLEGKSDLIRTDLFKEGIEKNGAKLAEAWRRSAEMAREALSDKASAAVIDAAADLLEGKKREASPELLRAAQVMLATELIDRSCWNQGGWNSFGVLRSVRALRSRSPIPFDMPVAIGAARALAEAAITSDSAATPLPPPASPSDRAALREGLDESYRLIEKFGGEPDAVEVRLFQLRPGMVLITPIVTRDGVYLVPASTRLDPDLIWRIWEIAAIRPLRDPIEVMLPPQTSYRQSK